MGRKDVTYLQLYPDDLLAAVAHSGEPTVAVGARVLLWCVACKEKPPGTLPDDDGLLARWANLHPAAWAEIKPAVTKGWKIRRGRWYIKRIRDQYKTIQEKRARATAAALSRHNAKTSSRTGQNRSKIDPKSIHDSCKDIASQAVAGMQTHQVSNAPRGRPISISNSIKSKEAIICDDPVPDQPAEERPPAGLDKSKPDPTGDGSTSPMTPLATLNQIEAPKLEAVLLDLDKHYSRTETKRILSEALYKLDFTPPPEAILLGMTRLAHTKPKPHKPAGYLRKVISAEGQNMAAARAETEHDKLKQDNGDRPLSALLDSIGKG